jgi:two-component sensor histidine kinase
VTNQDQYVQFATLKGWFYVAVTSILFGLFAFAELRRAAELRDHKEKDERRIAAMLAEKDALMRELNHRVKNNLQLISSLISLRMDALPKDETRRFFTEFLTRIRTISIAQDKLYAADDLSGMDLGDLVRDVIKELEAQYPDCPIRFSFTADRTFMVPLEKGVPLSLAVNEILLNAIAHAFPGGRTGQVSVQLLERNKGLQLRIRDDGVGFDPEIASKDTIGFSLIRILVGQAGGNATFVSPTSAAGGTEVAIDIQAENDPST